MINEDHDTTSRPYSLVVITRIMPKISLDLLRLQPDSLVIHKDPLSFVRLRFSPRSNLCRELLDYSLLWAL